MAFNSTNVPFEPTTEQRQTVSRLKSFGVKEEIIRILIINPETKEPIAIETFKERFSVELLTAKSNGIKSAISVFHEGLNAVREVRDKDGLNPMYVPDYTIRMAAANKVYQLCSKGLLEPKIAFNKDDSDKDKFNKIVDGLNEGLLSTFESDSMTKALEVKNKVDIDEIRRELDGIKNKLGINA